MKDERDLEPALPAAEKSSTNAPRMQDSAARSQVWSSLLSFEIVFILPLTVMRKIYCLNVVVRLSLADAVS